VSDVVQHFLRFAPKRDASPTDLLAYCEGYQAAIAAASTHELTYPAQWRWFNGLRDSIDRCVTIFQEECRTERETRTRGKAPR